MSWLEDVRGTVIRIKKNSHLISLDFWNSILSKDQNGHHVLALGFPALEGYFEVIQARQCQMPLDFRKDDIYSMLTCIRCTLQSNLSTYEATQQLLRCDDYFINFFFENIYFLAAITGVLYRKNSYVPQWVYKFVHVHTSNATKCALYPHSASRSLQKIRLYSPLFHEDILRYRFGLRRLSDLLIKHLLQIEILILQAIGLELYSTKWTGSLSADEWLNLWSPS